MPAALCSPSSTLQAIPRCPSQSPLSEICRLVAFPPRVANPSLKAISIAHKFCLSACLPICQATPLARVFQTALSLTPVPAPGPTSNSLSSFTVSPSTVGIASLDRASGIAPPIPPPRPYRRPH
ncbi:hypothetical protein BO94DRAFT_111320 [Aspergillus sclerotioniger CBS 115572]|uniref:Uncharacterized protein n=1 Tax=Aspergillus sclerotioniger CBS 115572 TaxID=1450535 RepID=A0A317WEM9_9EURO|nr:hypothetical protein BO94DRAFT_111320 [Aspergillus sclerotioniger CBS 115572]PWY84729.1 hypothetical protein BO94DRAFT_111320 [Aspergillus sclerotioniger CBS 115572]